MPSDSISQLERELHEVIGGLELLDALREEIEQWLEEVQDDSKKEALENVLGHIEVMETEYRTTRQACRRSWTSRNRAFIRACGVMHRRRAMT